jgi:hypothetical protein
MLWDAYYDDVLGGAYPGLAALGEPRDLEFDERGDLAESTIAGKDTR